MANTGSFANTQSLANYMIENKVIIKVIDNTDNTGKYFGVDTKDKRYVLASGITNIGMDNVGGLSISDFTPGDGAPGFKMIHKTGVYTDKTVSTLSFADLAKVDVF
jgi:hypothetical protein